MGLDLMTPRSRVACSMNWASQVPHLFLVLIHSSPSKSSPVFPEYLHSQYCNYYLYEGPFTFSAVLEQLFKPSHVSESRMELKKKKSPGPPSADSASAEMECNQSIVLVYNAPQVWPRLRTIKTRDRNFHLWILCSIPSRISFTHLLTCLSNFWSLIWEVIKILHKDLRVFLGNVESEWMHYWLLSKAVYKYFPVSSTSKRNSILKFFVSGPLYTLNYWEL